MTNPHITMFGEFGWVKTLPLALPDDVTALENSLSTTLDMSSYWLRQALRQDVRCQTAASAACFLWPLCPSTLPLR